MIMQAEREGFDGAIIACYHDPSLMAARQAVDIPVVGFGESSMLLALTMGRKFGLFCPSPLGVPDFEDRVAQYGLKDRCVGVVPGYLPAAEQEAAMVDAHAAIEEFTAVARELISRGAEVIIPGCGLIAPCVRFAPGCALENPNGVTEIDGVPDHGPLRGHREDGGDAYRAQAGRLPLDQPQRDVRTAVGGSA